MKYGLRSLFVAALIAFAAIGGQALLSFATVSSASADELLPGLTPTMRPIAYSGDNGYTVQVANYDAAYSYSFSVTQGTYTYRYAGSPVSLTLAIRNIPLGESSTLTVTTSRTGYADASNSIVVYAKKPALTPTFGAPVPTYGEYSVQITNYDPAFTWRASSVKGSASIDVNGLVSVTNLGANLDDTLVVTTTRTDYVGGTAQVAATAWPLQTALTPRFGTVNEYVGGFDFQITNYDPAFTWQIWSLDGNGGDFNIDANGLVTILNSTPGVSKAVSVYAIRSGFENGRADITGLPIGAGLTPELDKYRSTANGFTVEITNFDSNFNWSFETELGSA
jgi:titin